VKKATAIVTYALLLSVGLAQSPDRLEWTNELDWEGDLSIRMVKGIAADADRRIEQNSMERPSRFLSEQRKGGEENRFLRAKLAEILGVDTGSQKVFMHLRSRLNSSTELSGDNRFGVCDVYWNTAFSFHGEGLLLKPRNQPKGLVIVLPDCDIAPEEMLWGDKQALSSSTVAALAGEGYLVVLPTQVNRSTTFSGSTHLGRFTNQPHREWIYRQAFEMGRHVIGYEVQMQLALLDWARQEYGSDFPVFMMGEGEGGLLSLFTAAIDPDVQGLYLGGCVTPMEQVWKQPIYRNLFGALKYFGIAELMAMTEARTIIVSPDGFPYVEGPPTPKNGQRGGAAPGKIDTPPFSEIKREVDLSKDLLKKMNRDASRITLLSKPQVDRSFPSLLPAEKLILGSGRFPSVDARPAPTPEAPMDPVAQSSARQERMVKALSHHTQSLMERSADHRAEHFWKPIGKPTPGDWIQKRPLWQKQFHEEVIGRMVFQKNTSMARSRKFKESERWTGYEIVLDLNQDVFAWGYLLLPRDLAPGERRPVVVCQHGLEGLPEHVIDEDQTSRAWRAYKAYAARLADKGFVVFAPHNPYRGKDDFRVLQRKLNPLGLSLFSVITEQHRRILDWLGELPFVDENRIAFYGLSYGGKSAMRLPALLDGYCLSICSADFNEWIRKNVSINERYSYMFTGEYEMFEFNLGHTFNYAEMAALIAPRPFMVERGHEDGVAPDEWVAWEFAKVRRFYAKMGIPENAEIEFFDGPHTINLEGTYRFLSKHLNWPPEEGD